MYERLLDEATRLSWAESPEAAERFRLQREHLLRQLTRSPTEALPVLLNALRTSDQHRQVTAVEALDWLGYPANESAIPALLDEIGANDPNSPVWQAAAIALHHIGIDGVAPYLIHVLLGHGEPDAEETDRNMRISWSEYLEGVSALLSRTIIGSEWARRCCPAVNYLLARVNQNQLMTPGMVESLLAIVEKAGSSAEYLLPTFLLLAPHFKGSSISERVRALIFLYNKEELADYQLLL